MVSIVRYRRLTPALKVIAAYVLLGSVVQWASSTMSAHRQNNLPLLHVYTVLEFACLVWFYRLVQRGFIKNKVFIGLAISFPVLAVLNALFLQDIYHFNTYVRSLESLLIITLALLWYYRALAELKIPRLQDDPVFWVNTGLLLYFSGNVLLFAFSNYILSFHRSLNLYIWAFHGLFGTLLYLFITVGLWKQPAR